MEFKEYKITNLFLDRLIDEVGRSLVGKILKRFELVSDLNSLKSLTKEHVYEELRSLKSQIVAYTEGKEAIHLTKLEPPLK